VALYGCVGHGPFVAIALELLDRDGVDLSGLARSDRGTGCAAVCVDPRGENQIVVASGANRDARMTTIPDTALGTSASPSLPDLIRQSMFAADTAGSVDPRIKSGGDEFGKLKRTHIIGKRSRTAH